MVIRQRRYDADPLNHRLVGLSREIYLYCRRIRKFGGMARRFSQISPRALQAFLDEMTSKKLMFRENERYLSLAVRMHPF